MNPSIDVGKIVELAEKAADLLAGQPAEIILRTPETGKLWWSETQIAEMSRIARQHIGSGDYVHISRTVHLYEKPYLIYSVQWTRGAVTIRAQGSRDVVADDIRRDAHYHWDGKDGSFSEALARILRFGLISLLEKHPPGPAGYCKMLISAGTTTERECLSPATGTIEGVPVCAEHMTALAQEGHAADAGRRSCASCGTDPEDSDPGKLCRACRD